MLIDLNGRKVDHTEIRSIELHHPNGGMTGPFDFYVVVAFKSNSSIKYGGLTRDAAEKFVNGVRAEIKAAERS